MFAPVALFVYARPEHTRKTVDSLRNNKFAEETDLIVFSDAPKTPDKEDAVAMVRKYVNGITGFKSVSVCHRSSNYGLAKSIIDGVTDVVEKYGRIIVLEDDMVTSKYFLSYMNDALDRYCLDERVISIHGYSYPVQKKLPDAFFLLGADCWGWATWKRGWDLFDEDGGALLDKIKKRKLVKKFDFNGSYPYSKMLKAQIQGKNDSWAIRWYASAFLSEKYTLYPGKSLINNIGNDNTGTHCGENECYDVKLAQLPVELSLLQVEHSVEAYEAYKSFFDSNRMSLLMRMMQKIEKGIKIMRR